MQRLGVVMGAVMLVACGRADETTADTAGATAAAAAATPAPAPVSAADIVGNWTVVGRNATGDSTLVTYDLAVPTESTFTLTFSNGQKVNGRIVGVAGDSIMIEAGPYASVLRRGVQVRTTGSLRLQDGKLVGTTVARYDTKRPDSVITVRTEGTRKP